MNGVHGSGENENTNTSLIDAGLDLGYECALGLCICRPPSEDGRTCAERLWCDECLQREGALEHRFAGVMKFAGSAAPVTPGVWFEDEVEAEVEAW